MVNYINFVRSHQIVFRSICVFYISTSKHESYNLSTSSPTFSIVCYLLVYSGHLCTSNYILLMSNHNEHSFIFLPFLYLYSEKKSFKYWLILLNFYLLHVLQFISYIVITFLYSRYKFFIRYIWFVCIFSQYAAYCFIFLMVSLEMETFKFLIKSNLSTNSKYHKIHHFR